MKKLLTAINFDRLYLALMLLFIVLKIIGVVSLPWGWTLLIAFGMHILAAILFLIGHIIMCWQENQDNK